MGETDLKGAGVDICYVFNAILNTMFLLQNKSTSDFACSTSSLKQNIRHPYNIFISIHTT